MVTRYEINCNDDETKASIKRSLGELRYSTGETNGSIVNTALRLMLQCEKVNAVLVKDAVKALQELKEGIK